MGLTLEVGFIKWNFWASS